MKKKHRDYAGVVDIARNGIDRVIKLEDECARLRAEVEKLRAALKLARDELAGLPHSLGYAFTHLPAIDAALAQQPAPQSAPVGVVEAPQEVKSMLDLNPIPQPACKHCGRAKGKHRAGTFECPRGRGNFPTFIRDQFYEPKKSRKPPSP